MGLLSFLRVLKNYMTKKNPSIFLIFHVKPLPEHAVFLEWTGRRNISLTVSRMFHNFCLLEETHFMSRTSSNSEIFWIKLPSSLALSCNALFGINLVTKTYHWTKLFEFWIFYWPHLHKKWWTDIFFNSIIFTASLLTLFKSWGHRNSPLPYQKRDQNFTDWKKETSKIGLLSFLSVLKNFITKKNPPFFLHSNVKPLPEHAVFLE